MPFNSPPYEMLGVRWRPAPGRRAWVSALSLSNRQSLSVAPGRSPATAPADHSNPFGSSPARCCATLTLLRAATLLCARLQAGPALTAARFPWTLPLRSGAVAAWRVPSARPLHDFLVSGLKQPVRMKTPAARPAGQPNIASFFTKRPNPAAPAVAKGDAAGEPAATSPNENAGPAVDAAAAASAKPAAAAPKRTAASSKPAAPKRKPDKVRALNL